MTEVGALNLRTMELWKASHRRGEVFSCAHVIKKGQVPEKTSQALNPPPTQQTPKHRTGERGLARPQSAHTSPSASRTLGAQGLLSHRRVVKARPQASWCTLFHLPVCHKCEKSETQTLKTHTAKRAVSPSRIQSSGGGGWVGGGQGGPIGFGERGGRGGGYSTQ